jgi:hypothetical protein
MAELDDEQRARIEARVKELLEQGNTALHPDIKIPFPKKDS